MKFLLFIFLSAATYTFIPKGDAPKTSQKVEQTVYICKGPSSKRFHSHSNCRGLSNCSTNIYSINLSDAQRMGRTACQICY